MKIPGKAKVASIKKQLESDIRWTIRNGFKWDAGGGASFRDGKWIPQRAIQTDTFGQIFISRKKCGVCAVAAHILRHQPEMCQTGYTTDVASAAQSLRVDLDWLNLLYLAVMDHPSQDASHEQNTDPLCVSAIKLGHHLRDYAVAYTKK